MKSKLLIAIILFSFLFVASCSKEHYYSEFAEIPNAQWNMNQAVAFHVNIDEIQSFYNLKIAIKHEKNYPYNNLWLFLRTTSPSGKMQIDTLNCVFTQPDFSWKGKCSGEACEFIKNFADSVSFVEPGNYEFEIIQGLRVDSVPNILAVGFIVDKL